MKTYTNTAENCEVFTFHLDETKHPIAFANKLRCLMSSGMSEPEARRDILTIPFEMEIYYEIGSGLMAVESEAVEAGIYSPYSGKPYTDPENPVPAPMNKLMFGEQACRVFFNQDFETLVEGIKNEEIEFSLHEFNGDLPDLLQAFSGWGDYAFLTDEEYNTLAAL